MPPRQPGTGIAARSEEMYYCAEVRLHFLGTDAAMCLQKLPQIGQAGWKFFLVPLQAYSCVDWQGHDVLDEWIKRVANKSIFAHRIYTLRTIKPALCTET